MGNSSNRFLIKESKNGRLTSDQKKTAVKPKIVTGLLPNSGSFLTVSQVAESLGKTRKTILEWCASGKLAAIPQSYGSKTTYKITSQAVEAMRQSLLADKTVKIKVVLKPHQDYISAWVRAMTSGLMTGKPFSPNTVTLNKHYCEYFIDKHKVLSAKTLRTELLKIPPRQFSKRDNIYKAVMSFAKFLTQQGALDNSFFDEARPLKPKRHIPPKRLTVNEADLHKVFDSCVSLSDKLIVQLLVSTGIRASEACALTWGDIDFANGSLLIKLGKGNKTRRVGLTETTMALLKELKQSLEKTALYHAVLTDKLGNKMRRQGLYQRLGRIGKKAGVSVTPHALRRAFVTLNSQKGKPLPILQRACGHSDLRTTMSYCQIAEMEVIEAMKSWD